MTVTSGGTSRLAGFARTEFCQDNDGSHIFDLVTEPTGSDARAN